MTTLLQQMRDQIQEAVSDLPIVDSMNQLWDLPAGSYLLAEDDEGPRVWERQAYLLAQGMSSARGGALFTGVAKVLWVP